MGERLLFSLLEKEGIRNIPLLVEEGKEATFSRRYRRA
jgi:hypothetical protein